MGGILALLVYVLFLGKLLQGELFPDFKADKDAAEGFASLCDQGGDFTDYGKLLFWSFVAGFSQNFVTNLITRFKGEADGG